MGTANGSDPGRHRPMSATHDSVFKTGNPSSRHTPLGVPTPRGGSRFTALEPASAFAAASHGGIVLPRSVSARTENASSPAGSPAERDLSRPPASPAALPRQSAFEHRAAPRWSRPASPRRVNDTDPSMVRSIFSFRHISLPYVRGALGARGSPIQRPGRSSFRAVAEASAVIFYQPTQGAFTASVPTSLSRAASVSAPLFRGSPRVGLARTVGSRGSRCRCPVSPKLHLLSASPCAAARHLRHRAVISAGWPPRHPPTRPRLS